MNVLISALCLILAAVVQVSVLPYLTGSGPGPDLVLLLVVAWGIIRGVQEGLLWGLIGGLILDVLSAGPFGITMAVLGGLGFASGLRGLPLVRSSVFSPLLAAAVATLLYDGLLMVLLTAFGRDWDWVQVFHGVIVPSALLNAVAMLPIYWLLYWINRRTEPEIKW